MSSHASHDRLVALANRFLTGTVPTDLARASPSTAGLLSLPGAGASSAAVIFPTLPTPDYTSACLFASLALARFPSSVPARRILAACILAGADPFPFAPSTSAASPSPVTATGPGLLVGGISSAAAHAALQLLQSGPRGIYEDVGCAALFAQASAALSAYSEAHDALSWTVDHVPGFKPPTPATASASAKGKGVDLTGLRIMHDGGHPHAGPSQSQPQPHSKEPCIQPVNHYGVNAHLTSLNGSDPAAAAAAAPASAAAPISGPSASVPISHPTTTTTFQKGAITVFVTPRAVNTLDAQRSQTLLSLGHLAARGNRLAEAASSFEAALDADPWNWAAWAGLCDVGRVGGRRGVADGGHPHDTLGRWPAELGGGRMHVDAEFLPDRMPEWHAELAELVAAEAAAESRWRMLGGGGGSSGENGATTQSAPQSQPSQPQGRPASSQSQSANKAADSAGTAASAASQHARGRSESSTSQSTAVNSSTTTTYTRAGSRNATGSRSTAAGQPGSNKRVRSAVSATGAGVGAGADASVASSTRSAAVGGRGGGGTRENRVGGTGPGIRAAVRGGAGASRSAVSNSVGLPRIQSQQGEIVDGAAAGGDGDEPMLLDEEPPPQQPAPESAALVEGRQNLPALDATPAALVVLQEYEKGNPPTVRRSTRTNAQGGGGAGAAGGAGALMGSTRLRAAATGTGTGSSAAPGSMAARRLAAAVGAAGNPTLARAGAATAAAGRGLVSAAGRTQGGAQYGSAARGASGGGPTSSSTSARRGTTTTSTRPALGGGRGASKSSSSTDSGFGGTGSVSSLALPNRSTATTTAAASSSSVKGTRRAGVGAGTAEAEAAAAAAAAALNAAAAELEQIRAKRLDREKQIQDAVVAARAIAARWNEVDLDIIQTIRQLAEAYRTVRLYEGRKTAYLLRGPEQVAQDVGVVARAANAVNPHELDERERDLMQSHAVYGGTVFEKGVSDALRNTEPVRCLLGRAAHDSAKYAEAEQHFDAVRTGFAQGAQGMRSSSAVPTRHMDIYSLVLFHLNREVKLSALAQDLGLLDANAAETHIACGNAFALQREHAQAMRAFKRAALIAPACAYAYTLAGYEAIELSQPERAVGFFRSAIRVDMRHWNAWAGLGQIFLKIGKMEWAEAHYREALWINPHHAVLKDLLGWTYESQGRWNEALSEYDAALAMSPKLAMTRLKRAELLTNMENYEDAHEELLRVAALVPDESRVHILLAKSYMRLGGGRFVDAKFGSSSGGPQGADKSTSMAHQEPISPNRYHDAIAFHLSAAIDLDPKNVRIIKAMAEGARVALKGTRQYIDASMVNSTVFSTTVDSSMYPGGEPSGDVLEDGPDESGITRVSASDQAMVDGRTRTSYGNEENRNRAGGVMMDDDEDEDEDDVDDEDDDGEEEDDDDEDASDGDIETDWSDDDGVENASPDELDGDRRGHHPHGIDEDESENIEPQSVGGGIIGGNSENSYRQQQQVPLPPYPTAVTSMPPPSAPVSGGAPAAASSSTARAGPSSGPNASMNASSSVDYSGNSMSMSEEQSMELDRSL